jgi:hypothetical protein
MILGLKGENSRCWLRVVKGDFIDEDKYPIQELPALKL